MSIRIVGPDASTDEQAPTRGQLLAAFVNAALTGNPTAPTQAPGTSSTRIASTAFVAAVAALLQPEILQLEAADPIPGGTPAGTIIVRKGA